MLAPFVGLLLATYHTSLFTGNWQGYYVFHGITYQPITFTIDDDGKINGSYDFSKPSAPKTDIGTVEGDLKSQHHLTIKLKFGGNEPWAKITGNFSISVDGSTLTSDDAKFFHPHYKTERKEDVTVVFTRQPPHQTAMGGT